MILDFFEQMGEAVEYLIALGSLMGVLGLIVGIIGFISLGQFRRHQMIGVIVVSIMLLAVCGTATGFKYFHIRH
jgi:hypothetical protein